jgi:hypothetical protein
MRDLSEIASLLIAGLLPISAYSLLGVALLDTLSPSLREGHSRSERLAWAYALGTGAASLMILALRAIDIGTVLPLCALALGAETWRRFRPRNREAGLLEFPPRPQCASDWIDWSSIGVATLLLVSALGPETFWDGFEYHLPMATAWTEGPIRALPGVLDAEFRAAVDLLYIPAIELGQPDAAALVSAGFAVSLALLIRAEAVRRAGQTAGACAAFFWLVTPFVVQNSPSTYVDLGVGLYGAIALLAIDRWNRGGAPELLTLAGLTLAFALNAKLHAFILAPIGAALLLAGGRPPSSRQCMRSAAIGLVLVLPWFAKAWATSGNPLFPLFPEVLGAGQTSLEHLSLRRFRLSTDLPAARDLPGFVHYVAPITLGRSSHFSGQLGALPLALAPLAISRPTRATAALLCASGALFLGMYFYAPALRFGVPLFPLLAVASAAGGARLAKSGVLPRRLLISVLVLLGIHHLAQVGQTTLPRIAGIGSPHAYERVVFPDQDALREVVGAVEGVVAIPKGAVHWMPNPVYVLHWERNGEIFFDPLPGRRATEPDRVLAVLRKHEVIAIALDVPPTAISSTGVGHPTVDHWIAQGLAVVRVDVEPRPARRGRVWVLIELLARDP